MLVGFDVETFLIQPGLLAPPLVCGSFAWRTPDGKMHSVLYNASDAATHFKQLLLRKDVILVAQNGAFDNAVFAAYDSELLPLIFQAYEDGRFRDTLWREKLLDIEKGHVFPVSKDPTKSYSLAGIVYRRTGKSRFADKNDPKAWRLRYAELAGLPIGSYPKEAYDYAIEDATDALWMCELQSEGCDIGKEEPLINEVEQLRKAWSLHLISVHGIRTDATATAKLRAEIEPKYAALREQFYEAGFYRIERCTAKDIREGKMDLERVSEEGRNKGQVVPHKYVKCTDVIKDRVEKAYAAQGLPPPLTDGGNTSTDSDTLYSSGDPLLAEFGGAGPVSTIHNTFLPTLEMGVTVPINTDFDVLKNTGRVSSRRPNLNNIPRSGGVRECFVPRPGYDYVSVDYDCAELRSHAQINYWLFGWSDARDFFVKDPHGDPHLELAASILGLTTDEAKKLRKSECTKATDKDCKHCTVVGLRQACKAINFGLPGGMGAEGLVASARKGYNVHFSTSEAWQRKEQWKARWREMEYYFGFVRSQPGVSDQQATIMQMRPGGKPHRKRGGLGYCDLANTLFQGLTADGATHALWLVTKECWLDKESPLYGSRVVIFLYDELIIESPKAKASAAGFRLAEVMKQGMQCWTPDVPVTCSPARMSRWYKGAETVINDKGELMSWEPRAE